MGDMISIETRILVKRIVPPEQLPTIAAPTRYHEELEAKFRLERDDYRFALGWAWFCVRCNEEATTLEAYAPEIKTFLLIKASCRNCGTYFLHPGCDRFVTEEGAWLEDEHEYWVTLMKAWAHQSMSLEVRK